MGYSGCHIPGHSGTDFKHKKAFKTIRHFNKWRRSAGNDRENGSKGKLVSDKSSSAASQKFKNRTINKRWKGLISMVLFTGFLFAAYLMFTGFKHHETWREEQVMLKKEQAKRDEQKEFYSALVYNGNNYLFAGKLDQAQSEFTRALAIFDYGKSARIGLTKMLIKKCASERKLCKEAKEQLAFLKAMDFFDEKDFQDFDTDFAMDH